MNPEAKDASVAMADAVRIVGVDASTLRRWEREGKLTSTRTPGGHRRYRRSDLDALLSSKASA